MRAKTFPTILGGIILAVAMLISIDAVRRRHGAEDSFAILAAKRASLAAEIEQVKSRRIAAEKTGVELARILSDLSPPAGAATAQKNNAKPAPPRTFSEIIANDPKMEVLMLRRQRALVLLEYAPLFRALKLPSEQILKFQDNCVKHEESSIDLRAAARAQDDLGKQTVAKLQEQAKADYEASQLEILGADGYRQMQEFLRTEPMRNVLIRGLAGAAALEGVPLTGQQGEQLLQAALKAASRDASVTGENLIATIDWVSLDAQASQILSPAQFTLFTTVAPPSGFTPRGKFQLDAVIRRALQADAATGVTPAMKPSGG